MAINTPLRITEIGDMEDTCPIKWASFTCLQLLTAIKEIEFLILQEKSEIKIFKVKSYHFKVGC